MASTRKRALETGQGATKTTETSADLGDLLPKTHLQIRAGLAQLVEHVICNHGVGGSNPSAGTSKIKHLAKTRNATNKPCVRTVSANPQPTAGMKKGRRDPAL